MSAFNELQSKTCLKFRPRRNHDLNFIWITGDRRPGCWTTVGMRGGEQILNLNVKDGCVVFGRVLHELMHVVGFYHQHSASNRDNYVQVLWDNVLKSKLYNFLRHNESDVTDLGVPYDYNSILHYPIDAASNNKQPTLVTLKKNVEIGQRVRLSSGDITKVNRLYHKNCEYRKKSKANKYNPFDFTVAEPEPSIKKLRQHPKLKSDLTELSTAPTTNEAVTETVVTTSSPNFRVSPFFTFVRVVPLKRSKIKKDNRILKQSDSNAVSSTALSVTSIGTKVDFVYFSLMILFILVQS